jgi:NADH-quinone oxidoreductase subunit M
MVQDLFFGPLPEHRAGFPDLGRTELAALIALLFFVVLIGVSPAWLLDVIGSGAAAVLGTR